MAEIELPGVDLTKANLLFEKQPSGLYLPIWQEGRDGAGFVTPIGGYAGPEGAPNGGKISATDANSSSVPLIGTLIDVVSDPASLSIAFLSTNDGSSAAVVDIDYPILPGERLRIPTTAGYVLNAICDTGGSATLWYHVVV